MINTLFTIAIILSVFVALLMNYDLLVNRYRKRLPRALENAGGAAFCLAIMLWIVYLLCLAFIEMGF